MGMDKKHPFLSILYIENKSKLIAKVVKLVLKIPFAIILA